MTDYVNIKPEILVWARETSGFDRETAAKKLGFSDSKKATASEKLTLLETGETQPTRRHLAKFSDLYKRPLATFYLKQPPVTGHVEADFRKTKDNISKRESALLDTLCRNMRVRQELVRSYLEDGKDITQRNYVGSANIEHGAKAVAKAIAQELNFDHTNQSQRHGTADKLFKTLRERTENIGIFTLLLGDVGSYHSKLDTHVFRGFTIVDKVAPFIVINKHDTKPACNFTLIHELTHIWLGTGGISGHDHIIQDKTEQFCDDVAGEFLLPDGILQEKIPFISSDNKKAEQAIKQISNTWSVSESMVAYQLYRKAIISQIVYQELYKNYQKRWMALKKKEKEEKSGGPHYYILKNYSLGSSLVSFVKRTLENKEMTQTKAAQILDSRPGKVQPFLDYIKN